MFEWLEDYQEYRDKIAYLDYKIEKEKKELKRWTSGDLTKVKLTEDSIASGIEDRLGEMEWELAHKMNSMFDFKRLVGRFEGLENKVLYKKNVEGKSLVQIAIELDYSYSYIKSKHAEVMRRIRFSQRKKE